MDKIHPAKINSQAYDTDRNGGFFSKLIFVLLLLMPTFASPGIASAFYALVVFVALQITHFNIKRGLILLVSPFFLLFLLGMLEAHRYPLFDVMKDVWYLAKVVFSLAAGYLLMQHLRSFQQMCRLVVFAAVIAAIFHLIKVLSVFQSGISLMVLGYQAGNADFITTVGLGLLVGIRQVRQFISFNKWSFYLSLVLCAGSLLTSSSRTNIISFTLMLLVLRGWGRPNLKSLFTLASLGVVLAVAFISGVVEINQDETSLLGKFAHSITEVTIRNYDDMNDISQDWRGFESYRAYQTYLDGSIFEKAFGQGCGALVDLGIYMTLSGADYKYIPVLHNGYMYVLVKYGLLGVMIYLYFMFRLIRVDLRVYHQQSIDFVLSHRLISALGWTILFASFVVAGVFNISVFDSSLVILGASVAWFNSHIGRKTFPNIHLSTNE